MIEYIEGDIFESPAQVIVNPVNTVGVMGKGLALAFKKRYPRAFERYKIACEKHLLTIGKLMLFYEPDYWLLMFPTKENWRNPSKLEYIEKGLEKFVCSYAEKSITSVAFPRLGCGNGELKWDDVKLLMEKYLGNLPINVYIYLGTNTDTTPEHKEPEKTINWLKRNAKDMSFDGVRDDLRELSKSKPYAFVFDDKKCEMTYGNKLNIAVSDASKSWEIEEEEFYLIWDDIRVRSAFADKGEETTRIVYALLNSAGYLSRIKISDANNSAMASGYQINAGVGRAFAFVEDNNGVS